ncbi:unnamed protein product [Albugo candida]|nr:unnamed protein product [Albugo candida]|eukprot:CCI48103.1 unnamed protein product [Albugo candida]
MYFAVAHGGKKKRNKGKQPAIRSNDDPIDTGKQVEKSPVAKLDQAALIKMMGLRLVATSDGVGVYQQVKNNPDPDNEEAILFTGPLPEIEPVKVKNPLGHKLWTGSENIGANERRRNKVGHNADSAGQSARDKGKQAQKTAAKPSSVTMPSSFILGGPSRPT